MCTESWLFAWRKDILAPNSFASFMGLIKDIYSPAFYDRFAENLLPVVPGFDKKRFTDLIFQPAFAAMEWKERMKHTTRVFHEFLPENFAEASQLIEKVVGQLRKNHIGEDNLAYIFLADYIEVYGIDDFNNAVRSLEFVTQFISCEFAVRPFILKYGQLMLTEMEKWSLHQDPRVRRLASEGSRPRLPWAMAIPALKKDPSPVLPILENLRNDPSEYVRRSVANNLNDIAKDHPGTVLEIAARWKGISKETDAIVKHGCRTLLKQGHPEVLKLYGLESKNVELIDFAISTPEVKTGDYLEFNLVVGNNNPDAQPVRLEYGVYYKKSKGHLARKVFKLGEKSFQAGEQVKFQRKQSFKIITTRVFYPGEHQLSIIINGEEKGMLKFELKD